MNTQETKVKSQAFISIETAKPYKYDKLEKLTQEAQKS